MDEHIRQCCRNASGPVALRASWRFEPCDQITEPNQGLLVSDTGSVMVSVSTYKEAVRLLGGTLPPTGVVTEEGTAFQMKLMIHRPPLKK